MEYNTQQRTLPLPEYGRSVQNMVDHALTIEDRAERQRCANTIINIMGGMFPHLRDVPDFKHKLWDRFCHHKIPLRSWHVRQGYGQSF